MEEERKKRFKKYIYPRQLFNFLFSFFSVGVFVYLLNSCNILHNKQVFYEMYILVFLVVASCVASVALAILKYRSITNKINEIEQRGELPFLLDDFETAGNAFNGSLKMGQTYLFGKETGGIFTYYDIVKISRHTRSKNGRVYRKMLKVKTADGKTHDLCSIPTYVRDDMELNSVIVYIKSKNQYIDFDRY